jgi:hypothetical protein
MCHISNFNVKCHFAVNVFDGILGADMISVQATGVFMESWFEKSAVSKKWTQALARTVHYSMFHVQITDSNQQLAQLASLECAVVSCSP